MPKLVIGNKCYSSWSLRPWLLMRQFGIDFSEIVIPLGQSQTKEEILKYNPAGKVPVLIDGDICVWESIAIFEYVAEVWGVSIWPQELAARTYARSIVAEMHAGFSALRTACPMNLGRRYAPRFRGEAVERDVARIETIFRSARQKYGAEGPFLFGRFSAADAMYAPVVTRLDTYALPVASDTRQYMDAILALPAYQAWLSGALAEPWTYSSDEVDEEIVEVLGKL